LENMMVQLYARIGMKITESSIVQVITTTRFDHTPGSWLAVSYFCFGAMVQFYPSIGVLMLIISNIYL
jgi:hypothetical protein